MCGRYYIEESITDEQLKEKLDRAFRLAAKMCAPIKTEGDIAPFDIAPVIAPSALHRSIGAFPMQWGFRHPTKGMPVFNTRCETVLEKPLFVTSVDERRCLVPASGYYEWKKLPNKKKERYAFTAETGEPLYMAGLYIRSNDMQRLPCFSILTKSAYREIAGIHDRMPVLIPFSRAEEWLSPDTDLCEMIHTIEVGVVPALS